MSFPKPLLAHVGVYSAMWTKPGSAITNVANLTRQKILWWKMHREVTAESGFGAADRENQQRQDFVSKAQGKGVLHSFLEGAGQAIHVYSVTGIKQKVHAHTKWCKLHLIPNADVSSVDVS